MNIRIPVENRREGELIRVGLQRPEVRAFVKVCAALAPLSERGQRRVLHFFEDQLREQREADAQEHALAHAGSVAAGDGPAQ